MGESVECEAREQLLFQYIYLFSESGSIISPNGFFIFAIVYMIELIHTLPKGDKHKLHLGPPVLLTYLGSGLTLSGIGSQPPLGHDSASAMVLPMPIAGGDR